MFTDIAHYGSQIVEEGWVASKGIGVNCLSSDFFKEALLFSSILPMVPRPTATSIAYESQAHSVGPRGVGS